MVVVITSNPLTSSDVSQALEDYPTYIKITIDLKNELVAIGGQYHADAEKVLIDEYNSRSENIWGGGYNITSQDFECNAMINIRPSLGNNSMEILDQEKRAKFLRIAKAKLINIESFI